MLLNELLTSDRDYITKEEIEKVEELIRKAHKAMDEIFQLVGEQDFGCDYEEEEGHFIIWSRNASWSFDIVD